LILAQIARPPVTVAIEAPRRRVTPGDHLDLTLTLAVDPGYRIESVDAPAGRARATSIQLGLAEGLTPGPMTAPEDSVDPLGGGRVPAYVGRIAIRVPLTVDAGCLPGPAPLAARVHFQATGERGILPPDQIEVHAELDVAAG
jgi:hypothetical protein